MIEVGFGIGSNIGDKVGHVRRAAELLVARAVATDLDLSPLFRTAPWGGVEQDWFVNACAAGRTRQTPAELLATVKAMEVEIGRTSTLRWGPRVIDIDILFYGDLSVETPDLVLPHREILRRPFVLVPLAAIRPAMVLGGRRVDALARAIDDGTVVPL